MQAGCCRRFFHCKLVGVTTYPRGEMAHTAQNNKTRQKRAWRLLKQGSISQLLQIAQPDIGSMSSAKLKELRQVQNLGLGLWSMSRVGWLSDLVTTGAVRACVGHHAAPRVFLVGTSCNTHWSRKHNASKPPGEPPGAGHRQ